LNKCERSTRDIVEAWSMFKYVISMVFTEPHYMYQTQRT